MKKKEKAKRIKRKSRFQILLTHIIVGLVLSAAICSVGFMMLESSIQKSMEKDARDSFFWSMQEASNLSKNYDNMIKVPEDPEEFYISPMTENGLAFFTSNAMMSHNFGIASETMIFDPETGELVGDTYGRDMIRFQEQGKSIFYVLTCDYTQPQMGEVVKKREELEEGLNQYYRCSGNAWAEIEFDQVLINVRDKTFIPVHGRFRGMDFKNGKQVDMDFGSFGFEVEVPEGYRYAEGYGATMGGNAYKPDNEQLHQTMLEIAAEDGDGYEFLDAELMNGSMSIDFLQNGTVTLSGKEYAVAWGIHLEGWSLYYQHKFILGCGITVIIVTIIAVLSGIIRYNKLKAAYDMEDYRRKTTNALAHDLKTPLTAIMGYADNLRDMTKNEEQLRFLDGITANSNYTNELLTSYLDLARAEQLRVRDTVPVELVGLAGELGRKYALTLEQRGIELTFSGECTAKCHKESITQAVENLLSNAVKYTPDGGTITVTGTASALTIRNTASGQIPDTQRLTEPFYKPDTTRTGKTGSGLGLSIVQETARAHGFRLTLTSTEDSFTAELRVK